MKKWLCGLCILLVMLPCAMGEAQYFTSRQDRYYHLDSDCDRPDMEGYPRAAYEKYEISGEAAERFEKEPCPLCVQNIEPVYLGNYRLDWPYETAPWAMGAFSAQEREVFRKTCPPGYLREAAETEARFSARYEESDDGASGDMGWGNPYPEAYAGRYLNDSYCMSYLLVSPTPEMIASFQSMYGSGAWILPAKYGYAEMRAAQDKYFEKLINWCDAHPEADAMPCSANVEVAKNLVALGIAGSDWQQAAAALDDEAPLFVVFIEDSPVHTAG